MAGTWNMHFSGLKYKFFHNTENVMHCCYVIHINMDCCSSWLVFEDDIVIDIVHHSLECCWGVSEAKVHDCGFKEPIACFEGHFVFISFMNTDIIVPPLDIKFCVNVGIAQVTNEVQDTHNGAS